MLGRVTDSLASFTIEQAARLWAEESGEHRDLIERKLLQAAYAASSDPNSDDVELRLGVETSKYDDIPAAQRDDAVRATEKEIYSSLKGLYVDHRSGPITAATPVRRLALEAWCEQAGFRLPQFLKPTAAELESRARAWLRECVRSVEQQLEVRKTKGKYRASAQVEFGGELSKRVLILIWDDTVPEAWRRGGRPKKPKHQ